MNKGEFMSELRLKLAKLSEEERAEALAYYEEYFEEAGPEQEVQILSQLGSPAQVAKQIMGEHVIREATQQPISAKQSISTVWIVLLAILASPIAFPLAIAFVAVVFAVVVTVFALVFAGGAVVVALGVSFVAAIVAAGTTMAIHPATGVFMIGIALIVAGFMVLIGMLMSVVISKGIPALTHMIVRGFTRIRGGKRVC
ncbi:MAG: DUF1700 domain-containing protein [Cellulosilyticaceae bacterium]